MLSLLDPVSFVIVAISNRILEGWTFGLIQSVIYGVSSQELPPEQFDRYARTWSASAGLGQTLSMLLGSYLFSIGGYFLPYFSLSGTLVLLALIVFISGVLRENFNDSMETMEESLLPHKAKHAKISLSFALGIREVRYGWLSIIISNAVYTYLDPIIALKFYEMDIFADQAGYIYLFLVGAYSLFGALGGVLEACASKKTIICLGYIAGLIGFSMIGHYSYLGK